MIIRSVAIVIALFALTVAPRGESQENSKYTVLTIEYFGALDKPIFPIVLSNSYGGAEWYQGAQIREGTWDKWYLPSLHVVNHLLLEKLIATVESHKGGVQPEPGKQYSYNGVSMTIVTLRGRKIFLFHIEPGMTLLDQLEELCKDDKSLHSDLLHFQERVRPWGHM